MNRVTHPAEESNAIPTANKQNNTTAFTGSVPEGNVSNRSGAEGEEEDKTLMLSRELALFINPKQADLTASLIIYGLYTWQVSKRMPFGYQPTINGKPCCYRSLRELTEEYPWLHHTGIRKALQRAAKALKGDFIMQLAKKGGQEQCHFLLSDSLIKKYKFDSSTPYAKLDAAGKQVSYWKRRKAGLISLQKSDALKFGLLEAILISNLQHVVDPEHNVAPLKNAVGNIYRQLSPGALTKPVKEKDGVMKAPLPVSRDTVERALERLKTNGPFYEHPLQNNYFTLVSTMKPLKADAAEVNTHAAEVNTYAAEVNTKTEVPERNVPNASHLRSKNETPDSNRDGNEDGKCVSQETSPLRCDVPCEDDEMSAGAKMLMELVNEDLSVFRQRDKTGVPKFNINDYAVYQFNDFTDEYVLAGYELDHELIRASYRTGKPYTRENELDDFIAELEQDFILRGFHYTTAELNKFHALFVRHPILLPEHLIDLLAHDTIGGIPAKPEKGHDDYFFARIVTSAKTFLRYMPQLIREKYVNGRYREEDCDLGPVLWNPDTHKPIFNYMDMEQPYFDLAFADDKQPVTHVEITTVVERPQMMRVSSSEQIYKELPTGETCEEKTTRLKPVYYSEFMRKDWGACEGHSYDEKHPHYQEMCTLPAMRVSEVESLEVGERTYKDKLKLAALIAKAMKQEDSREARNAWLNLPKWARFHYEQGIAGS